MTKTKIVNVKVTFKNTDSTEALKTYAHDKVENCVSKFIHGNADVHVVLNVDNKGQVAEATFHSDGSDFNAKVDSDDMYTSIDGMVNSLSNQLRKHKEKLTAHH